MSLLTLIRHGQASYMSEDYDRLSGIGQEQARKIGVFWARHRWTFDQVFYGPAKRHLHTMEIARNVVTSADLPWPDPVLVPGFDEFDAFQVMKAMVPVLVERDANVDRLHREFRQNQSSPQAGKVLQALFEEVARHWCSGEFDIPEIESWDTFRSRIASAIELVRAAATKSSSVAVFTSGGPIAATIAQVLNLDSHKAIEFVWLSRNCSYSEFLFTGDRFSMSSFNSFPHLDDHSLLTYR
ncbi:MAG: histidine phosphatase family protein [Bryobacteraceae bacterium]